MSTWAVERGLPRLYLPENFPLDLPVDFLTMLLSRNEFLETNQI